MQPLPVSTFLWFEARAHEAAASYCAIFPDAEVTSTTGQTASFRIGAQRYIAYSGGPHFQLNPATSIMVACATQAEVDEVWRRFLAAGARESRCGWLVDAYGLSWQILPTRMLELINDPDPAKARRAVAAMMTMAKIDLAAIERAHAGHS